VAFEVGGGLASPDIISMRQIPLLRQEVQEVLHGLGYEVAQARVYLACDVCFGYLINLPEYTVA